MGYKEKQRALLLERAHAKDLCDDRNVAFCASASALPNGEKGIALLSLKGGDLFISDIDMYSNIGETLYTVPMAQTENFKIGWSLIGNTMRFDYKGNRYAFTNMVGVKEMQAVIQSETTKKREESGTD